jgi:hypothetical protein
MKWLDDISGDMIPMRSLLGNSHPDRRMVDAELALRHLAFSLSPLPYRGNLKSFLDETSKVLNHAWEKYEVDAQVEVEALAESLEFLLDSFGPATCRKWSKSRYERALNRAIFDVQAYSFSYPSVREAAEGASQEILDAFKQACEQDAGFVQSITSTTKARDAFLIRHRTWANILQEVCSISYPLPRPLTAKY